MKVLSIIGSPRKNGNCWAIAHRIEEKIGSKSDVDFEHIFLSDLNFNLCKGCGICIQKGEDCCPLKDDRKYLEEKILNSDGVILISPVYAMNMSATMKNFLDRFSYTMHRPRFFNQYTMVVSVTGSVGLKETLKSLSAIKYSGYNIVSSFGIVAKSALANPFVLDKNVSKKVATESEMFYKKILSKKPISPPIETIIQFKIQQQIFKKSKNDLPYDYEYFNKKGWFDKNKKYYVNNTNINQINNMLASIASLII